jgi:hypothetical protein
MVSAFTGGAVPAAAYPDAMTPEELSVALVSAQGVRAAAARGRVRYVSTVRAAEEPRAAAGGPVALVHFNQLWANVSHSDLHRLTIFGPPKPPL